MVMYYFEAERYDGEKLIYIYSEKKKINEENKFSGRVNIKTSYIKKADHIIIVNGEIYRGV